MPTIEQVYSLEPEKIRQFARAEVLKILAIFRGVMEGVTTTTNFNLWFEWFYPKYLNGVVEGTLNAFHEDDEVVQSVIRLVSEVVYNRNNRMRFDTWNINGLIAFKEATKYVVKLLQIWDSMRGKVVDKSREYQSKWKFIKLFCELFKNVITGGYINFAICEYYQDEIFTQLTRSILLMLASVQYSDLKPYAKLHPLVFSTLQSFFANHLELLFTKIEPVVIYSLLRLVNAAVSDHGVGYETASDCNSIVNMTCEYVHEKLKKPATQKQLFLVQQIQRFCQQHGAIFGEFL